MAELLTERGWEVTVLTATPLAGSAELEVPFKIIRGTNPISLLLQSSIADVTIINGGISILAGMASLLVRTPFVIWHQMAGKLFDTQGAVSIIRNAVAKWISHCAAAHVGVSRACLDSKRLDSSVVSQVIYNPVARILEQASQKPISAKEKNIDILYVGRLIEGKGILVLIDSIRKLVGKVSPLRVAFIGTGPLAGSLESMATTIPGVEAILAGPCEVEQLVPFYRRSRCLVLPSTSHPEGMPLVIGEAQTFGLPVVASNQPANIEAVGSAGIISQLGNAEHLASDLTTLLTDKAKLDECVVQARMRAPRFGSKRFADQVEQVLHQVIASSKNRRSNFG